jgi:hypothetical protein
MKSMRWVSPVLVLSAFCLLGGCGGGGTPSTSETPVGLTKAKKDELSTKFKDEAKQAVTKENAEKVAKDLEAEINADAEK